MKLTILSRTDYAGSGHKLRDALSLGHDVEIFTGYNQRYLQGKGFGHRNQDNIITPLSRGKIQKRINQSDVVLIKGDWPMRDKYMRFKIDRPTIQIVSGMNFRKVEHGGRGGFYPAEYKATINAAFEPDLLYPEYGSDWIPHPIDSMTKEITWVQPDIPVLIHAPSNRVTKNTKFILKVFKEVQKRKSVEIIFIENLSFDKVVEAKKRATIYFDQFRVGFYGNAAIEAMQYGIPTCAWVSRMSKDRVDLKDCPILTANPPEPFFVKQWAKMILDVLNTDMSELSSQTKTWCDNVHSYEAILKRCNEIFNKTK